MVAMFDCWKLLVRLDTVVDFPPPVVHKMPRCRGRTDFLYEGIAAVISSYPTGTPMVISPSRRSVLAVSIASSTKTGLFGNGRNRGGINTPLFNSSPRTSPVPPPSYRGI